MVTTMNWPTLQSFLTKLKKDFKEENKVKNALIKLENLKQKNKTTEEPTIEFQLLVGEAELLVNSNPHLIWLFQKLLSHTTRTTDPEQI